MRPPCQSLCIQPPQCQMAPVIRGGSRWQCCFTIRICPPQFRPDWAPAALSVWLCVSIWFDGYVILKSSGLVPHGLDTVLCVTVFALTPSLPCVCVCVQSELYKVMWPKFGHVTKQWLLSGQLVAFVWNNYPVTKCWVKVVSVFAGASYFAVGWEASQKVSTSQSSLAPYLSSCRSLLASIKGRHPDMNYRESSPPSSPPLSSHALAILTLKTTPRRTSVSLRIERAVNSSLFLPSG